MPNYNISEDILNMQVSAKLGQLLKYPDQKRNVAKILKRTKPKETNLIDRYVDEDKRERDTMAVKCHVRIKNNPIYAILGSEAAVCIIIRSLCNKLGLKITKPSKTIVITADGKIYI